MRKKADLDGDMSDQEQWAQGLLDQIYKNLGTLVATALFRVYRPAVAAQIAEDLSAGRQGLVLSVMTLPGRVECALVSRDGKKRETLFALDHADAGPSPPLSKALPKALLN